MKIKPILIALSFAVGTLTACAESTPLQRSSHSQQVVQKNMSVSPKIRALFKQDTFKFRSAEWFAGGDPLAADVTAHRLSPQVVAVNFKFDEPLDPKKWRNPSMLHYFMFCFAAVHSQATGHSKWITGRDSGDDFDYSESTKLTTYFAAIGSKADLSVLPTSGAKGVRIIWDAEYIKDNEFNPEFCKGLLNPDIFN